MKIDTEELASEFFSLPPKYRTKKYLQEHFKNAIERSLERYQYILSNRILKVILKDKVFRTSHDYDNGACDMKKKILNIIN